MKICSKTHHLKIFPGEVCPRTPLANAWLRHASQAACDSPSPPKVPPTPGKSYIGLLSWTTTKKFI